MNADLPELAGNVLPGKDFGRPATAASTARANEFGHGTAMASIMVGRQGVLGITGLAPDAKILPDRVPLTGTTDAGSATTIWPRRSAGRPTTARKVISMSLGGARKPATDNVPCPADEQDGDLLRAEPRAPSCSRRPATPG